MKSEELWPGRLVRFITADDNIPEGTLCTVLTEGDGTVRVKRHDTGEAWDVQSYELEPYEDPDDLEPSVFAVDGTEFDPVNKPKHYQLLPGVEVIDVLDALCEKLDQSEQYQFNSAAASYYAQAMGYLMRCMDKNGKQDVQKAIWYLQRLESIWEE